ncbi:MAG: hypothetical protein NTW99_04610 [Chloroflexi bacterium]|nr:hypothetical protein [Chloroflexota bacterium]MCX6037162.1 hypothetical protein [Chloroflexota bacterium]
MREEIEENEKDGAERHALNKLRMRGLARRPSLIFQSYTATTRSSLLSGGGYDPRLRQMQVNMKVLQDFYE